MVLDRIDALEQKMREVEIYLAPQIEKARKQQAEDEKARLAKVSSDIEQRRKDAIEKSRQEAVAAAKRDGREPPVYSEEK